MMARKCSQCGNNGHNSRTCSGPGCVVGGGLGLKLFGVHLSMAPPPPSMMKKSFSMNCLSSCYTSAYPSPSSSSSSSSSLVSIDEASEKISTGYQSDCLMDRAQQERKKGIPWSEEEHRAFLAGLEKLGKGDWRGISRSFVTTRTPTQVASHAQKYFLRQSSLNKKKRRSSLFDVVGFALPSNLKKTHTSPNLCLNSHPNKIDLDLNTTGEEEIQQPPSLELIFSIPETTSTASLSTDETKIDNTSQRMLEEPKALQIIVPGGSLI